MTPTYIDNSTLKAVARCSTETVLRYVLGYVTVDEKATLRSGSAGHDALAHWLRGGTKDEALDVYDYGAWCEACAGAGSNDAGACTKCDGSGRQTPGYRDWAEANVASTDRLSWQNVRTILSSWCDENPRNALPWTSNPRLVEIGFAYPLDETGEYVLTGRMDALALGAHDRQMYVVEHKFTGRISEDWLSQFVLDSQNSGYIWAAGQHTKQVVVGSFLNAVELSRVPSDPNRRCQRHAVPYSECGFLHVTAKVQLVTRTPEALEEWRKTAVHLAKRYRDLARRFGSLDVIHRVRMQGTFHGACRFCAFQKWCSRDRPVGRVAVEMSHEPWEPFPFAFGERGTSGKKP